MESFVFNGVSSQYYDIIVKKMPPIVSPLKNIESITIDGRNGNLHIDNGTYKSYDLTIECVITSNTKINDIKKWLTGTGIISFSTIPNIEFDCLVKNQISFDKYLTVLKEFPIQLEISPLGRSTTETTVTKTANGTFTVGGTVETSPILEVKGDGDGSITLNNTTINITDMSDTAIIIDCDLMNAVQGLNSANSQINCDEFPKLIVGTNTISMIGATEVKVKYKERWL